MIVNEWICVSWATYGTVYLVQENGRDAEHDAGAGRDRCALQIIMVSIPVFLPAQWRSFSRIQ